MTENTQTTQDAPNRCRTCGVELDAPHETPEQWRRRHHLAPEDYKAAGIEPSGNAAADLAMLEASEKSRQRTSTLADQAAGGMAYVRADDPAGRFHEHEAEEPQPPRSRVAVADGWA